MEDRPGRSNSPENLNVTPITPAAVGMSHMQFRDQMNGRSLPLDGEVGRGSSLSWATQLPRLIGIAITGAGGHHDCCSQPRRVSGPGMGILVIW